MYAQEPLKLTSIIIQVKNVQIDGRGRRQTWHTCIMSLYHKNVMLNLHIQKKKKKTQVWKGNNIK